MKRHTEKRLDRKQESVKPEGEFKALRMQVPVELNRVIHDGATEYANLVGTDKVSREKFILRLLDAFAKGRIKLEALLPVL